MPLQTGEELYLCGEDAGREPGFEELFDAAEDFGGGFRFVDRLAQSGAAGDTVSEPAGELLHLADSVGEFFLNQHLEIGADHLVAVEFGGLVVGVRGALKGLVRGRGGPCRFLTRQYAANSIRRASLDRADECVRAYTIHCGTVL